MTFARITHDADLIRNAELLVKEHMAKYDPSHDWAHVDRVRHTALRIATTLPGGVDTLVIELAALFHDLADAKYTDTSSLPTLLQQFFSSPSTTSTVTPSQIGLIQRIIPSVSWSTEKRLRAESALSTRPIVSGGSHGTGGGTGPADGVANSSVAQEQDQEQEQGEKRGWTQWHETCPELHAVQDADRLDAIGAVGILRVAAFSGAKGRELVGKREGVDTAEQHFYDKLLKVRERMKTQWGKEEAERRHQTMLDFLSALDRERGTWLPDDETTR